MQKQLKEAQEEAIRHKQYVQKQLKELKERANEDAISHKKQLAEKDAQIKQLQAEIERLKDNNK